MLSVVHSFSLLLYNIVHHMTILQSTFHSPAQKHLILFRTFHYYEYTVYIADIHVKEFLQDLHCKWKR